MIKWSVWNSFRGKTLEAEFVIKVANRMAQIEEYRVIVYVKCEIRWRRRI